MTLYKHHSDSPQVEPPDMKIAFQTYQARNCWRKMVLWCLQSCKVQPRVLGAERDTEIQDKWCFSWEKASLGLSPKPASTPAHHRVGPRPPGEETSPIQQWFFISSLGVGYLLLYPGELHIPCLPWGNTTPGIPLGKTADGTQNIRTQPESGMSDLQGGLELVKGDPATHPGSWGHRQV